MLFYIALSAAVCVFCCVVLLLQKYGERTDALQRRLSAISDTARKGYLPDDELSLPFSQRFSRLVVKPLGEKLKSYLRKKPGQADNPRNEKLV